jgi:RNA polymerase sigma-70 factor, ECF subfamily
VDAEAAIKDAVARGAVDDALATALATYGAELASFLAARAGDPTLAEEAFALLAEDLWRGLPSFRFDASVRTWAYVLARRALARAARAPARDGRKNVPLSQAGVVDQLAHEARQRTIEYRRTTTKDRFAALRAQLTDDERELLVLRVDRALDWKDLARVLADAAEDGGVDDKQLAADAAKLRKRFERLKEKLRGLAIEAGLLPAGTT